MTPAGWRSPASGLGSSSESADFDSGHSIEEMIRTRDADRLGQLLLATRIAQTLISSFDSRVGKLKDETETEALLSSRLYCKIQRTRGLYESVEEKLLLVMKGALAKGADNWLLGEIQKFSDRDAASQAATANLLRSFALHESEFCEGKSCFERSFGARLKLPFRYADNRQFLAFMHDKREQIAQYSEIKPDDIAPGDCFGGAGREPNGEGAYDWKSRNHVKSGLDTGEFVITYDDGPHASNTERLMRLWEDSGYPKPAFFWLTKNATVMPEILAVAAKTGFPIGLHSERHADLGTLAKAESPADFNKVNREIFGPETADLPVDDFSVWKLKTLDREVPGAAKVLTEIVRQADTGYRLKYFRLPFGSGVKNDLLGERLAALDVEHFFWAVDSLDWQDHNPESVFERVTSQMRATQRGIILFHDVQPPTVATTEMLLELFKSGETWKPVSITKTLNP